MDSSSSTMDNNTSLFASLEAMDVKTLFKHLDEVTKALKKRVKEASKGRRRKNKTSDSSADGDASSTSSKKTQPAAVAEWNTQCKEITAVYKASLPEGTKLKPGFHLRLAGAVKHLAGDKPISVTAETVAAAVAFLEQNPDWSTKTTKSRAEGKAKKATAPTSASKPKSVEPIADADSDSDSEPEVKPKAKKDKKAEKAAKSADKPKKAAKKPAKKADSDDESSDSDSEPEVKPKAKKDKKADKKTEKADKKAEKAAKKAVKSAKKAAPKKAESDSESSDSEDDSPAAERVKFDGQNYWVNPSTNDVYEDVDGSLGDKIGKLNEDGDGIIFSSD